MSVLAVGDEVWIKAIVTIGAVVITIVQLLQLKAANRAAVKVEQVKETLESTSLSTEEKLQQIEKTGEDTHTLVNANMGAALNINRISTRRLAELTNDAADWEAADVAERLYRRHEERQAVVDATE